MIDQLLSKRVAFLTVQALLLACCLRLPAIAQNTAAGKSPAFDIVSIRPDASSARGREELAITPDGWHMAHGSLMGPLLTAYIPTTSDAMMYTSSTLTGIPDWVRTASFNIDAKVAEADLAAWHDPALQPAMLRAMMQTMLADRCKLVVHRSVKEVAVYLLIIDKGGPKLKTSVPGEPHPHATQIPGGGEFVDNDGKGNASFYAAPVRALTVVLSNFAGRPIEDKTGLTGIYEMSFRRPHIGALPPDSEAAADQPPTVFDVVKSFGLRLEPAKRLVETLSIDHLEKPSDN